MSERSRILVAHASVYIAGALLLGAVAVPLSSSGSGLDTISWPGLVVPSLVLAILAGAAENAYRRAGRLVGAKAAFVALSLPALGAPLFYVGRWPGDTVDTDPSLLGAALMAWTAYIATEGAVAAARPRRANPDR